LALGTAGQVLTVNSGEDAPEWATPAAGGMTLLSTTTLSGASTTISGIDQTYIDLQVVIYGTTNASANYYPYIKPNGTSLAGTWTNIISANGAFISQAFLNDNIGMNYNLRSQTNAGNFFTYTIYNYASSTIKKNFIGSGFQINSSSQEEAIGQNGLFDISGAITSLVIEASSGTYDAGTVLIYGVK
jgi:hypothetical protein